MPQMHETFKQYGYASDKLGGHQVVAKPVVDKIFIRGLPAKDVFARELVSLLQFYANRDLPESLSAERLEEALEAVLALRVLQVQGKRVSATPDLDYRTLVYPAFLWPIIRSVGDIIDRRDAIELRVEFDVEMQRFNEREYAWDLVAETLRALHAYGVPAGLVMATALPKDRDGILSVLTFMTESGRLVSHTHEKSHADALVRSALNFVFGAYVWGTPRWEYNDVEWYHSQLRVVVRDAFRRTA